jgi:hypothetical protein
MVVGHPVLVDFHNLYGYEAPVNYGTAGAGAPTFLLAESAAVVEVIAPEDGRIALEGLFRRGPAAPPAVRLDIEARSNGRITSVTVTDRVDRIPVDVDRGYNEIELRAAEIPRSPGRTEADQLVAVDQLHPVELG